MNEAACHGILMSRCIAYLTSLALIGVPSEYFRFERRTNV
jgi:hypothetical protein